MAAAATRRRARRGLRLVAGDVEAPSSLDVPGARRALLDLLAVELAARCYICESDRHWRCGDVGPCCVLPNDPPARCWGCDIPAWLDAAGVCSSCAGILQRSAKP